MLAETAFGVDLAETLGGLFKESHLFLDLLILGVVTGEDIFSQHLVFFDRGAHLHIDFFQWVAHLGDGVGLLHAFDSTAELADILEGRLLGLGHAGRLALLFLDFFDGGRACCCPGLVFLAFTADKDKC